MRWRNFDRFAAAVPLVGCLLIAAFLFGLVGVAEGAAGVFDRAWGQDVVSGNAQTGFEICTVASQCKVGASVTAGRGGEFFSPQSVATDAAGNVYVADSGNNRIQKFDSSGNFLLAWGKNVSISNPSGNFEICVTASDCQIGETGGLRGEMSDPFGVAADAAGNVYVADTGNNRVQKFNSNGQFQRAWVRTWPIRPPRRGPASRSAGTCSTLARRALPVA